MSRTDVLLLLWLTWSVLIVGSLVALFMALTAGGAGHPYSGLTLLELVVAFSCVGVVALSLTGILLERDGSLLTVRLGWVVPILWAVGLFGLGAEIHTIQINGPQGEALWPAVVGLAGSVTLSAAWFTRHKDAKRLAAQ